MATSIVSAPEPVDSVKLTESLRAGKWWPRVTKPARDLVGERDGRVIQPECHPARTILEVFENELILGIQKLGEVENRRIFKVRELLKEAKTQGEIGITMTGSMYIDSDMVRKIKRVTRLETKEEADEVKWFSLLCDALAETVKVSREHNFATAVGRILIPLEVVCDVPVILQISDTGIVTEIARLRLRDKIDGSADTFVPTIHQAVHLMFAHKPLPMNRYPLLTVGHIIGPQTRQGRGKDTELTEKERRKSVQFPQRVETNLMDEQAQRALRVNPSAYMETGTVTQSMLGENVDCTIVTMDDLTKNLASLSIREVREEEPVKRGETTPQNQKTLLGRTFFVKGADQRVSSTPLVGDHLEEQSRRHYNPDKTTFPALHEEDTSFERRERLNTQTLSHTGDPQGQAAGGETIPHYEIKSVQLIKRTNIGDTKSPPERDEDFLCGWLQNHPEEDIQFSISLLRPDINWKTTLFLILKKNAEELFQLSAYRRSENPRKWADMLVRNIVQHLRWDNPRDLMRVGQYLRREAYSHLALEDESETEMVWDQDPALQTAIQQSLLDTGPPLRSHHVSLPPMVSEGVAGLMRELTEDGERNRSDSTVIYPNTDRRSTENNQRTGSTEEPKAKSAKETGSPSQKETQREHDTIRQKRQVDGNTSRGTTTSTLPNIGHDHRNHNRSRQGKTPDRSRRNRVLEVDVANDGNIDDKTKGTNQRDVSEDEQSEIQDSADDHDSGSDADNENTDGGIRQQEETKVAKDLIDVCNQQQRMFAHHENILGRERQQRAKIEEELLNCKETLLTKQRECKKVGDDFNKLLGVVDHYKSKFAKSQASDKSVEIQRERERNKYVQQLKEKQNMVQSIEDKLKETEAQYAVLQKETEGLLEKENSRANTLARALQQKQDMMRDYMSNLPPYVSVRPGEPYDLGHRAATLHAQDLLDTENVHGKDTDGKSDDEPNGNPLDDRKGGVELDPTTTGQPPVKQKPFEDTLTTMIKEKRRADGSLRIEPKVNSSEGQLQPKGISRSELVTRGATEKLTSNPQSYYPGNTVDVMSGLPYYDGALRDDRSDTTSETSEAYSYSNLPKYDPLGRPMPTATDMRHYRLTMKDKSDREVRIKQIPEFKKNTEAMYWEEWRAYFLSEARQLNLDEKERSRIIMERCKDDAKAVIMKVHQNNERRDTLCTSQMMLDELSDKFFDTAVRLQLEKEIHSSHQDMNRTPPETLYEFCSRVYRNCQRLHSENWRAADQEWLGSMNRGLHSRREYQDYIEKNTKDGKSPDEIIKILRDLGEHKTPGTTVTGVEATKPAARQFISMQQTQRGHSTISNTSEQDETILCGETIYFSEVTFGENYVDPKLVEGCAQVIYHLWKEEGDDLAPEVVASSLIAQRPLGKIATREWIWNLKRSVGELLTARLRDLHKTDPIPMIAQWGTPRFKAFLNWFLIIIKFLIGSLTTVGDLSLPSSKVQTKDMTRAIGGIKRDELEKSYQSSRLQTQTQVAPGMGNQVRKMKKFKRQQQREKEKEDKARDRDKSEDTEVKSPGKDLRKGPRCFLCKEALASERTCANGARHYCSDHHNLPVWRELTSGGGPDGKQCVLCFIKATEPEHAQAYVAESVKTSHFR